MKYLIIGAGGTGGCIAAYMHKAEKDVTLIARRKQLEAIKRNGLTILGTSESFCTNVPSFLESDYTEKADVIFVCVKYYSIFETYDLIKKSSHEHTIVIPILNVYGTGEKMAESLNGIEVLNGCIYIASAIEDYGVIKQYSDIFRIVYGRLDGKTDDSRLITIKQDILDSGIDCIFSSNIKKDTMSKFSFVSCMGAVGFYFNAKAKDFKQEGKERDAFISCIKEIVTLSKAMGIYLDDNIVDVNLTIMDNIADDTTTSMQKDLLKGGQSEADGLVFEVVRLAEKFGVDVPMYRMIAEKLK